MNFIPSCFQYKSAYFKNSPVGGRDEDEAREITTGKNVSRPGRALETRPLVLEKRLRYFQSAVEKKRKKKRM